jgi:selenocysteine lyase/cysteine desulfurase
MMIQDYKQGLMLDGARYLNCAYMGPVPQRAILAGREGISREAAPYKLTPEHFFSHLNAIREQFAHIVGATRPDSIALFPAVSYGMATIANNIRKQSGNIVVVENEFPSNYYIWRELAARGSYQLRVVPQPGELSEKADLWSDAVIDAIDRETALVSLSSVHWIDGTTLRLDRIAKRARAVGSHFIVDGTQSLGVAPFPMDEIRPDAVICAGYKWLLGPYSLSVGYFGDQYEGGAPLEHHWLPRIHSDDFANLTNYQSEFRTGMMRFDSGESSNFILAPMLLASLQLINEIGVSRIASHVGALTDLIREAAHVHGWTVMHPSQSASHYITIPVMDLARNANELLTRLAYNNVYASVRGHNVRITPHIYNNTADIHCLLGVLSEHKAAA